VLKGRRSILKSVWVTPFERNLWRNARMVQAVCKSEFDQLEKLRDMAPVKQIPNGVPRSNQDPNGSGTRDIWLFLGRLAIEQKGLYILLQAYARALARCPTLPQLVLAGPDFRGGTEALSRLAAELGISDRIELGPVTGIEKTALWGRTLAFFHPSRWEGMPLSILEALSHGIPCIVSPETGLAEWIENYQCGWKIDADPSQLSEAIIQLSQLTTARIRQYGVNARCASERDYSWERIGTQLKMNTLH